MSGGCLKNKVLYAKQTFVKMLRHEFLICAPGPGISPPFAVDWSNSKPPVCFQILWHILKEKEKKTKPCALYLIKINLQLVQALGRVLLPFRGGLPFLCVPSFARLLLLVCLQINNKSASIYILRVRCFLRVLAQLFEVAPKLKKLFHLCARWRLLPSIGEMF